MQKECTGSHQAKSQASSLTRNNPVCTGAKGKPPSAALAQGKGDFPIFKEGRLHTVGHSVKPRSGICGATFSLISSADLPARAALPRNLPLFPSLFQRLDVSEPEPIL